MTAARCRLHRQAAHAHGYHSIALRQAIAFELGVRQKDVIGEWLPKAWPGISDVHWGKRKWLMGLRWEQIDVDLILKHRLSKSVRGRNNVMNPDIGTVKGWDLKAYPMIMEELARLCGGVVDRSALPTSGLVIICEGTGRPWTRSRFQRKWREAATAAGIPVEIQNRDSRPGAANEAKYAGAPREDIQRQLGHADAATTEIYLREEVEENRKLAKLRVKNRK